MSSHQSFADNYYDLETYMIPEGNNYDNAISLFDFISVDFIYLDGDNQMTDSQEKNEVCRKRDIDEIFF